MNFTQDQIAAIIGSKELEIINLRMQLGAALARVKELTPPAEPEKKPDLKVVEPAP